MPEPLLLAADNNNKIFDLPGYLACGASGDRVAVLSPEDLLPLPKGASLFFLPDRSPIGFNRDTGACEQIEGLRPAAAFMPPGYTQTASVAYREQAGAGMLPLFAYTPVALYKGQFHVPAVRVDRRQNHNICSVDKKLLGQKIRFFRGTSNRLIRHLAVCAETNFCPNAINLFLGKYEAPLPTSPVCNARCLGCISYQPQGSCPATQPRLTFVPTAGEIAEVALYHMAHTPKGVVSFGQGCEGEPLLQARVILEAVKLIRRKTPKGTIHMNTNGSLPDAVDALGRAGIDSFRVSLNSARPEYYHRYYMPRHYAFADVRRSIRIARRQGKFVSLNYLTMPGFTDDPAEFEAFRSLIGKTGVQMIQWRNLNYDPQLYFRRMKVPGSRKILGIKYVLERLKKEFPALHHGYFNLPRESW